MCARACVYRAIRDASLRLLCMHEKQNRVYKYSTLCVVYFAEVNNKQTNDATFHMQEADGGDKATLDALFQFMYEGCIRNQSADGLPKLMAAANFLQIKEANDACKIMLNERLARTDVSCCSCVCV